MGLVPPAGIVHKGEFVVPKEGVDQKTGTIKPDFKQFIKDFKGDTQNDPIDKAYLTWKKENSIKELKKQNEKRAYSVGGYVSSYPFKKKERKEPSKDDKLAFLEKRLYS